MILQEKVTSVTLFLKEKTRIRFMNFLAVKSFIGDTKPSYYLCSFSEQLTKVYSERQIYEKHRERMKVKRLYPQTADGCLPQHLKKWIYAKERSVDKSFKFCCLLMEKMIKFDLFKHLKSNKQLIYGTGKRQNLIYVGNYKT